MNFEKEPRPCDFKFRLCAVQHWTTSCDLTVSSEMILVPQIACRRSHIQSFRFFPLYLVYFQLFLLLLLCRRNIRRRVQTNFFFFELLFFKSFYLLKPVRTLTLLFIRKKKTNDNHIVNFFPRFTPNKPAL